MMDPSLLLMLSNLLHLHNYLDPAASLLSDCSPPPSASSSSTAAAAAASSSAAPLLFFAIASVLSYTSSSLRGRHQRRRRRSSSYSGDDEDEDSSSSSSPPPPPRPRRSPSSSSSAAFFSLLNSDRIWSMDPAARDARWRSLYGLSYPLFAKLLDELRPLPLPLPLPADHALALALSRLSRGLSSPALARSLSLPPSLVSRATHAITRLLATRLYPAFVQIPSSHRLLSILQSFRDISSLPNLCGSIASSAVRLRLPPSSSASDADLRSPHRPFPSVLLQAVADHRRIFWDACVRAPGAADPASHLRDSRLYHRLASSDILREPGQPLRGGGLHLRPFLAGDPSFPLLPFLLTPFSSPSSNTSNPAHDAFDAALSKARAASVEPAIALLKGRWKILRNLNVGLDHAAQTIVACVVLHNMCQIAGEPEDEGKYLWRDPPETPQPARPLESERSLNYHGESLRQALADDLYDRQQRLSAAR